MESAAYDSLLLAFILSTSLPTFCVLGLSRVLCFLVAFFRAWEKSSCIISSQKLWNGQAPPATASASSSAYSADTVAVSADGSADPAPPAAAAPEEGPSRRKRFSAVAFAGEGDGSAGALSELRYSAAQRTESRSGKCAV